MSSCRFVSALSIALLIAFSARADVDGAKKALETLKKNIADDNKAGIDSDVKLVEFELKDTPDADKKAIQTELDGIKKKLFDEKVAKLKPGYQTSIEKYLTNAKQDLAENHPDGAVNYANSLDEYLTHDDIVELFSADEIAKYKERMAKYKKMGQEMQITRNIDPMYNNLADLEKETRQKLTELKTQNEGQASMNAQDIERSLASFEQRIGEFPKDNAKVKEMYARLEKLKGEYTQVAGAVGVQQKVARLKDSWDLYKNEWEGWEAETAGPSIEEYGSSVGNTDMHAFKMPHSIALYRRADSYMENFSQDDSYKQVATNPDVKAVVDGIAKMRADCYAKVLKAGTTLVEQAEKLTISKDNIGTVSSLPDDIRSNLGEKTPEAVSLKARAQKIIDNYQAGLAAADKAFEDNYKKMCEDAGKAWPAMKEKFSITSNFDPNKYQDFKGKTILIDTDNLMGWKFKADGSFPFATTVNGLPVAARYTPEVAAAIKDVEAKVKHGLGNIEQDGRWQIIATVDGNTGRLNTREVSDNEVRSSSGERLGTVREEATRPVDAPIVTIIAAHIGPLAVATRQGVVSEAGIVPSGAAGASSSGSGWAMRCLYLIVGLVAAAACLLKAGYAPVTSLPQVGEVQAKLGGDNLAYIGLACVAWGVLWLLLGKIIYGLVPNIAVIAAGAYAAIDFLAAKGIVKPEQAAKVKPMGVMIGLGCAAAVVLSFLIGGRLVIL